MSKSKETTEERLARMKREQEEAKASNDTELVNHLTHESDGKPDFAAIVDKLSNRKEQEAKGENDDCVKMTIYIQEDIAKGFNALCVRRGDQKRHANQALADYIIRKSKELGL